MNKRIQELIEQSYELKSIEICDPYTYEVVEKIGHGGKVMQTKVFDKEKFAKLIVRECMTESMDEIVSDEDIAQEGDPLVREYLKGNNQGIVDAVIRFRNHFGVEQ